MVILPQYTSAQNVVMCTLKKYAYNQHKRNYSYCNKSDA